MGGAWQLYLTEPVNQMVSLKPIHPPTRQLNSGTWNSKIKLTDLWVNCPWRNHSINALCEIKVLLHDACADLGAENTHPRIPALLCVVVVLEGRRLRRGGTRGFLIKCYQGIIPAAPVGARMVGDTIRCMRYEYRSLRNPGG